MKRLCLCWWPETLLIKLNSSASTVCFLTVYHTVFLSLQQWNFARKSNRFLLKELISVTVVMATNCSIVLVVSIKVNCGYRRSLEQNLKIRGSSYRFYQSLTVMAWRKNSGFSSPVRSTCSKLKVLVSDPTDWTQSDSGGFGQMWLTENILRC